MSRRSVALVAAAAAGAVLAPASPGQAAPGVTGEPAALAVTSPYGRIVPISRAVARQRPVLRVGSHGIWVRRVNRALHVGPAAQPFGRPTARAVRAFRVWAGMRSKALVNTRTWMRLGSLVKVGQGRRHRHPAAARPVLQQGDTSAWVVALQNALGVQPATGYFGTITLAAVRAFQAAAGLPVTGIVAAATWAALGDRVVPPAVDVTTTDQARTSRSYRAALGVRAFVRSPTARMVVQRESGGQCDVVDPSGTYHGKWQMDASFWSSYGGLRYAASADLASCRQQDRVAYRGWIDHWWQPWPTSIP